MKFAELKVVGSSKATMSVPEAPVKERIALRVGSSNATVCEAPVQEFASLKLGGADAAVAVCEAPPEGDTTNADEQILETAAHIAETAAHGGCWEQSIVSQCTSNVLLRSIQLAADECNKMRLALNKATVGPLGWEEIVEQCGQKLSPEYRRFMRWAFLVRVTARKYRQDLRGLVAMVYLPPRDLTVGNLLTNRTTLAILHQHGEEISFRGYFGNLQATEFHIGGTKGTAWIKDLWIAPGANSIDVALSHKRYQLLGGKLEADISSDAARRIKLSLKRHKRDLSRARNAAGVKDLNFPEVRGSRLSIENAQQMDAGLDLLRAILAVAVAREEDTKLDEIAARSHVRKGQLVSAAEEAIVDGPESAAYAEFAELAGREAESCIKHLTARMAAESYYREVSAFTYAKPYLALSRTAAATLVPDDELEERPGVHAKLWPVTELAKRVDADLILGSPGMLRVMEDLDPVVQVAGACVSTYKGQDIVAWESVYRATDRTKVIPKDDYDSLLVIAQAMDLAAYPTAVEDVTTAWHEAIAFTTRDGSAHTLDMAEYASEASVRLIPQVKDLSDRRLSEADFTTVSCGAYINLAPVMRSKPCPRRTQK